jgi:hypothetical protein
LAFALLAAVLIRIARQVRVTFSDTELQMLRPGEFYEVPPAVGRVLVSEGWAVEPEHEQDETVDAGIAGAGNEREHPRSS